MTSFDIEVSGTGELFEEFEQLREDWSDAPTFIVESGAEYSVILEFGRGPVEAKDADALRFEDENGDIIYRTSVSGHPPYPFFVPAIREFEASPQSFLLKNTEFDAITDIESVDELLVSIASALSTQMKRNATAQASGRSPGTHPNHPQVQTGNLRARIKFRRVG